MVATGGTADILATDQLIAARAADRVRCLCTASVVLCDARRWRHPSQQQLPGSRTDVGIPASLRCERADEETVVAIQLRLDHRGDQETHWDRAMRWGWDWQYDRTLVVTTAEHKYRGSGAQCN